MTREFFGGGATGEPDISINSDVSKASTTTATTSRSSSDNHHLRCPRCDSSNTKFCYYNNYNLTQPRYLCKTCRRYWTKGGTLRNVPIGGGCRKNKGTTVAAALGKHISTTEKVKALISSDLGIPVFLNGFQHSIPTLWAKSPQTSHLFSLLRSNQNPNPDFAVARSNMLSPTWRNTQTNKDQEQENGWIIAGHERQNTGELYQGLRSSPSNYYYHDQTPPVMNNTSSSTYASTVTEFAPTALNGELGLWNPTLPWSDLQSTKGAYP